MIKRESTMKNIKLHENRELTLIVFDYCSFKLKSIIIYKVLSSLF